MKQGLGTQLRHLIELLDSAVATSYAEAGLDYRPRFTPVIRALAAKEPRTIGDIATAAGITQPAATQTVALMLKKDLLNSVSSAADGRQRLIGLSDRGRALLPQLHRCWAATTAAAASLDADLPYPLSEVLAQAIAALEQQPFGARIRDARERTHNKEPT
ncbi:MULTISPECIES: MarR family winged helix-turn-helix transcriptional regulator [Dyella]|uniref:MarR family transcriptional regulator n=2 Tax=Dyella TaxID=231454 RepID=A0A4R0YTS6_9GAMM|nr:MULTISPECIES: MarR family transcriptional regulator [Dyella]TBR40587.1 MarR family transcriptional regulator [Dyella terrae]TCI11831.1 MarR family transcriptional regulator [Dyella soli]